MTIYKYEIEVKVTNKNTLEAKLVTVIEHAYSVHDAAMQMCFALQRDGVNVELAIQKIGPPAADIQEQDARLRDEVKRRIDELRPTFQTALDAVGVALTSGRGKVTVQGPCRATPPSAKP